MRRFAHLILLLALAGCDKPRETAEPAAPAVSYSPRESGSFATPTTPASQQLFSADGPKRMAAIQKLIAIHGGQCDLATKAVLLGGLDGSDEWRVTCLDGGQWSIWLHSDRLTEVKRCPDSGCV